MRKVVYSTSFGIPAIIPARDPISSGHETVSAGGSGGDAKVLVEVGGQSNWGAFGGNQSAVCTADSRLVERVDGVAEDRVA